MIFNPEIDQKFDQIERQYGKYHLSSQNDRHFVVMIKEALQ